jgi:hypothetical protein
LEPETSLGVESLIYVSLSHNEAVWLVVLYLPVTSCGNWEGLSAIKAGGDGDDLSVTIVPA